MVSTTRALLSLVSSGRRSNPIGRKEEMKADLPTFPEWHTKAACFGTEAPFFFPPDSPVSEDAAVKDARQAFCDHCPVRKDCLDSALLNGDVGIWAGLTTFQRNQLRRIRNRVKCPVCLNKKLIPTG